MLKANALSQEQIKEMNRVKIIKIIKERQVTTKQEIAEYLGLSIPTVTTNINQLVEEGLVEEAGVAKSTGGRKPIVLKFVENAKYSFGANISGNKVEILLVNLNGEQIAKDEFEVADGEPFENILATLKISIYNLMNNHSIDKSKVIGVGLALPGLVDDDGLVLEYAPNMGISNFHFESFQRDLGLKISIENEANIAAFAEQLMGNAKDKSNSVYVSITEGVGTGIIIDNHIYKSNQKKAGEFGHIRISDEPKACKCGRTGCWETFASKNALIKYYKEETQGTIATIDAIFSAYDSGDQSAKRALKKYIGYLLRGIENIILALNPDYVIIGGELGGYDVIVMELAEAHIPMVGEYLEYEGTKILFSKLGSIGALMGAALLPLEAIFNYKKNVI
ncbi:MAG: ROK family transcriptional regulator [Vallitaleaceae bacterium]|nr:ROK family transcriptional regulator [Vallitaleaceae bacterium]